MYIRVFLACDAINFMVCSLLVFMQKIIFTVKKIHKNFLQPELLFLAQISTKSFGSWGFVPDLTGGAYSAPPDPIAVFRGPTSKGRKWGEEEREGSEEGEEKEERLSRWCPPPDQSRKYIIHHWLTKKLSDSDNWFRLQLKK